MAEIKIREKDGGKSKILKVGVAYSDCPLRRCFWYREHFIRSQGAGMSGYSSRASGWLECGTRDQGGCPQPLPDTGHGEWEKVRGAWERKEQEAS